MTKRPLRDYGFGLIGKAASEHFSDPITFIKIANVSLIGAIIALILASAFLTCGAP